MAWWNAGDWEFIPVNAGGEISPMAQVLHQLCTAINERYLFSPRRRYDYSLPGGVTESRFGWPTTDEFPYYHAYPQHMDLWREENATAPGWIIANDSPYEWKVWPEASDFIGLPLYDADDDPAYWLRIMHDDIFTSMRQLIKHGPHPGYVFWDPEKFYHETLTSSHYIPWFPSESATTPYTFAEFVAASGWSGEANIYRDPYPLRAQNSQLLIQCKNALDLLRYPAVAIFSEWYDQSPPVPPVVVVDDYGLKIRESWEDYPPDEDHEYYGDCSYWPRIIKSYVYAVVRNWLGYTITVSMDGSTDSFSLSPGVKNSKALWQTGTAWIDPAAYPGSNPSKTLYNANWYTSINTKCAFDVGTHLTYG